MKAPNPDREWQELETFYRSDPARSFRNVQDESGPLVSEWRWANDEYYRPTPFYCELLKAPKLKWVDQSKGVVEHGLTATGEILVMRRWPSADPAFCRQQFLRRQDGYTDLHVYEGVWTKCEWARNPQQIELRTVRRYRYVSDRLAASFSFGKDSRHWEAYEYRGDRLVGSNFEAINTIRNYHARREYTYEYGSDGELDCISSQYFFLPERKLAKTEVHFRRKKSAKK